MNNITALGSVTQAQHLTKRCWKTVQNTGLMFAAAAAIFAVSGCANTLPSVDPEEFTKWSKAHLDLPIYPGSYRELAAAAGGTESYMVSTGASVKDVRAYYLTEPANHGWKVQVSSMLKKPTDDKCMLIGTKANNDALLDITRQGLKTFISITYSPKGIYSLGLQR